MFSKLASIETVNITLGKSNSPVLIIEVIGTAPSTGWSNFCLVERFNTNNPPADGIYEYDFCGKPSASIQTATPITAAAIEKIWAIPANFKGVRIFSNQASPFTKMIDKNSIWAPSNTQSNHNQISPRKATGYSNSMSFDEAFQNAISAMAPDYNNYPDKLNQFKVTEIGMESGGIANIPQRMFVEIQDISINTGNLSYIFQEAIAHETGGRSKAAANNKSAAEAAKNRKETAATI